jgi:hypothetical protein
MLSKTRVCSASDASLFWNKCNSITHLNMLLQICHIKNNSSETRLCSASEASFFLGGGGGGGVE